MLDNFAPEVPTARIERKPMELVGFVSEASFAPPSAVNARPAKDSGFVASPATLIQAGSVCAVLTLAVVAVPGRATPSGAPAMPEIRNTRVFVATTPVRFSIAPAKGTLGRRTAAPITKPVVRHEPEPKPAARTKRSTSTARPLVLARTVERTRVNSPAGAPRNEGAVPSTAPSAIAARTIVTPPAFVAPATAAVIAVPSVSEETLVRSMLEQYRGAYERLDASAARQVWPSLDERRLARAFATLKSQTLDFEDCRIDVGGAQGVAYCRGRTTYVGRVGKREPETQDRRWTFQIRKTGDSWAIDSVRSE